MKIINIKTTKPPTGLPVGGMCVIGFFFTRTYFLAFLIAACAAASLAIGTRNGLQET